MTSSMKKLQREIGEWGDKTFPTSTKSEKLHGVIHHLSDEVYELMAEVMMYSANIDRREQFRQEVADAGILVFQLAYTLGFDLETEIREKMEINKKRKWGTPDERGVVKHIPE